MKSACLTASAFSWSRGGSITLFLSIVGQWAGALRLALNWSRILDCYEISLQSRGVLLACRYRTISRIAPELQFDKNTAGIYYWPCKVYFTLHFWDRPGQHIFYEPGVEVKWTCLAQLQGLLRAIYTVHEDITELDVREVYRRSVCLHALLPLWSQSIVQSVSVLLLSSSSSEKKTTPSKAHLVPSPSIWIHEAKPKK